MQPWWHLSFIGGWLCVLLPPPVQLCQADFFLRGKVRTKITPSTASCNVVSSSEHTTLVDVHLVQHVTKGLKRHCFLWHVWGSLNKTINVNWFGYLSSNLFVGLLVSFIYSFIYIFTWCFVMTGLMCCFAPKRAVFLLIWHCSGNKVEAPALAVVSFVRVSTVCVYVGTCFRKHTATCLLAVFAPCTCTIGKISSHSMFGAHLIKGQNNPCSSSGAALLTLGLFCHFSASACFLQWFAWLLLN